MNKFNRLINKVRSNKLNAKESKELFNNTKWKTEEDSGVVSSGNSFTLYYKNRKERSYITIEFKNN